VLDILNSAWGRLYSNSGKNFSFRPRMYVIAGLERGRRGFAEIAQRDFEIYADCDEDARIVY
jgi:hypothetical protein